MAEPWTLINLDGQNRPLRFNGAAFRAFELAYARSIGAQEYPFGRVLARFYEPASKFEVITSYNLLAHLLWAGLQWRWSTLTVDKVVELLSAFEDGGGDLIADVWQPLELAWVSTGMFKRLIGRVEEEAAHTGNSQAGPAATGTAGFPSSASGSATGTTEPPQ